jgi:hypothetical protein
MSDREQKQKQNLEGRIAFDSKDSLAAISNRRTSLSPIK